MEAEPFTLETLAEIIRTATNNAYMVVLCGNPTKSQRKLYDVISNVEIGNLVVETSTMHSSIDAVGILEEITQDPFVWDDPTFVWDEKEEGQPHPTETVYNIRTLDGRRIGWRNAAFITVPKDRIDYFQLTPRGPTVSSILGQN